MSPNQLGAIPTVAEVTCTAGPIGAGDGGETPIDATPARRHLRKLARAGVGIVIAAECARVNLSIARGIRNGSRRRALASTICRICAVTPDCRADCAWVPAADTWNLITELLEEGYTKAALSRMMGHRHRGLQISKSLVRVRTAAKIRRIYRNLTA
jgi:hypothetical protein